MWIIKIIRSFIILANYFLDLSSEAFQDIRFALCS